jgi:hypothetical protein
MGSITKAVWTNLGTATTLTGAGASAIITPATSVNYEYYKVVITGIAGTNVNVQGWMGS